MNLKHNRSSGLILLLCMFSPCHSQAYNQGSLFVFDLLPSDRAEAAAGRIGVSQVSQIEDSKKELAQEANAAVISEFEVDFSNSNFSAQTQSRESDSFIFFNTVQTPDPGFNSGWQAESTFDIGN